MDLISILLFLLGIAAIAGVYWALKPKQLSAEPDIELPESKAELSPESILPLGESREVPESSHQIPRHALDDNAMSVVYRLLDAGHEAYLVGGCVRDLLAGTQPKDFDVATSAHPEQAEPLFKRARLIGRRFKLLHVRFGREVIEVATFRASHDSSDNTGEHGRQSAETGMIIRDNVYGTIEDDALRRDFSINALYYSVKDHSILDFSNGYPDLLAKKIRIIGNPDERYREDPVRMLRAARFAAKLGFEIEESTAAPIRTLAPLIGRVSPARMFDESLKLLQSGYGEATLRQLLRFDLFKYLLPATDKMLGSEEVPIDELVMNALRNTDRRLAQGKSVTPAFLFAAMLWYPLTVRIEQLKRSEKMPALQRLHEAANQILAEQQKSTAIPRRFSSTVREIWELQHRLLRQDRADQALEHPRFRAGYDLLLLREESGEDLGGLGRWWTEYQRGHAPSPRQDDERSERPKRRRRPRNASQRRPNNRSNS